MKVDLNNSLNINFNGTLKIFDVSNQNSRISKLSSKLIEKAFTYGTKDMDGHMDLILYDRYNANFAHKDKIIFSDGDFTDNIETYIKRCNDNDFIYKLIYIFKSLKKIHMLKDNVSNLLK